MPIHLALAYVVFCVVPAGLAVSIGLRQRRVRRALEREETRR